LSWFISPFALIPPESPLWCQYWKPYNFLVFICNFIWIFSCHYVHIDETSCWLLYKIYYSSIWNICYIPVLSTCLITKNSIPCGILLIVCLSHKEWMSSIHIISWSFSCFNWISCISWP
jgi:hypothetical protein